jgi:hypothetical protein
MHAIVAFLMSTHGTAHLLTGVACVLFCAACFAVTVRVARRQPDYRRIHRRERELGWPLSRPVTRQRKSRRY